MPKGPLAWPKLFLRGTQNPSAIRWFGITSLFGHARHFAASALASESIDARDWMRPEPADVLGNRVLEVLRARPLQPGEGIVEALGRPLIIDFVADTGDDREISVAVGRMVFEEYTFHENGERVHLPRGDVLLLGGDIAYPVGTAVEIEQRLVAPWNEVLAEWEGEDIRPRVLLAIPGNHDWFDGLDGFARFARRAIGDDRRRTPNTSGPPSTTTIGRAKARVERELHLDEVKGAFKLIRQVAQSVRAFFRGSTVKRVARVQLDGYEAVQESTYFALQLTKNIDLWAVDRQLRRLDFRQRSFFRNRKRETGAMPRVLVAPDPAWAFGEPHEIGQVILKGVEVTPRDKALYLTGDVHHYERRTIDNLMHVIAGGGGAFVHGTRNRPYATPPDAVFPDGASSRRMALAIPWKMTIGRAGFLVHFAFAGVGLLAANLYPAKGIGFAHIVFAAVIATILYLVAGHHRRHRREVLALSIPLGILFALLPTILRTGLPIWFPQMARTFGVIVVYSFVSALFSGLFLTVLALTGWEHQQAFSVLSHPGYKHFVRVVVSPDGKVTGYAIGKINPLDSSPPVLIDRFEWDVTQTSIATSATES
ncbi:MAG: hypothetical protein KBF88_05350 [Polyangiaceae bacterium]|nr:hypothetical protein [Polyangiaceae bacterium]